MLSRPASWRTPPFLSAALALLPALLLWLDPRTAPHVAWGLAGFGVLSLIGGVGELVERRVRLGAVSAEQQHETRLLGEVRLLVGSCINEQFMVLERAGQFLPPDVRSCAREIIKIAPPSQRGLYVWEGTLLNRIVGERDTTQNWLGTWRRATPEEAQRYAAGEPVWGSR